MEDKNIQLILNGHNEQISKIEPMLSKALMDMYMDCKDKHDEELAGTMNFWYMEITTLIRKAGAIGYMLAKDKV